MKLREYGLTQFAYDVLLESQEGRCAICRISLASLPTKLQHIDHDHITGVVRGVLCAHCNRGLGGFKDKIASLANAIAIAYLKRFA